MTYYVNNVCIVKWYENFFLISVKSFVILSRVSTESNPIGPK